MSITVDISDTQGHIQVESDVLTKLVESVLREENREQASISIALVDNATIHMLNRRHLGHDWPTDVISFPLAAPHEPVLTGELVVSAEMALAQARELGAKPRDELALYVVHGLLHLCGYDDKSEASALAMRRRESEILTRAGLSNPYEPRFVASEARRDSICERD